MEMRLWRSLRTYWRPRVNITTAMRIVNTAIRLRLGHPAQHTCTSVCTKKFRELSHQNTVHDAPTMKPLLTVSWALHTLLHSTSMIFSTTPILRSWVPIPFEEYIPVSSVLFCVGADPRPKDSYQLSVRLKILKLILNLDRKLGLIGKAGRVTSCSFVHMYQQFGGI
jgi:hypothetical protein